MSRSHRDDSLDSATRGLMALCLCVPLAACGGANADLLDPMYADNVDASLASVERRVAATPKDSSPIAVGVSADASELLGLDVTSGEVRWRRNYSNIRSTPFLAGDHVIFMHEDRLQLLRRDDGSVRTTLDADGMQIVGGDGVEQRAVAVLRHRGGIRANSRIVVFINGAVRHDETVVQLVGAPVAARDLFIVPWQSQNVSAFDYLRFEELARLRTSKHVIANAFEHDGHIYFGNTEVGVWTSGYDEDIPFFAPQAWNLPGNPPLLRDSYSPAAPPDSAEYRVRRLWLPANPSQPIDSLRGKVTVHLYYRALFALEESSDAVRWARLMPVEIVGSRMVGDNLSLFGADGSQEVIDVRTGASVAHIDGKQKLRYVAAPEQIPALQAPSAAPDVVQGLAEVASSTDSRLVPAQRLAVRHLTLRPEPAATASLIDLCHTSRMSAPVLADACKGLSKRTSGQAAIADALARRGSFLKQTEPPRADILAKAAVKMNMREAVQALTARLQDPLTPAHQIVDIASAIGTLGRPKDKEALLAFFKLYRAEKLSDELAEGLQAVLQAAAKLDLEGTANAIAPFEDASDTAPALVATITSIRATYAATQQTPEEEEKTEQAKADEEEKSENAQESEGKPTANDKPALDPSKLPYQARLALALEPVEKELKACSFKLRKPLRLMIQLDEKSEAKSVTVIPAEATTCVTPHLLHLPLPRDPQGTTNTIVHNITWHK